MLNIFRGKRDAPQYKLALPAGGQLEQLTAHKEVRCRVSPKFKMAMLRLNRHQE